MSDRIVELFGLVREGWGVCASTLLKPLLNLKLPRDLDIYDLVIDMNGKLSV